MGIEKIGKVNKMKKFKNRFQKEVGEYIGQYKDGYWPPHEILARLMEETGELAREVNHRFGFKKKRKDENTADIELEVGDILFTICCFANSLGLDLEDGFDKVMDKINKRDAGRWEKK